MGFEDLAFNIDLVVSASAVLMSIISLGALQLRHKTIDTQSLSSRLQDLEDHQFTDDAKKQLQELTLKMSLLWSVIEKEFPKILRQQNTPELDLLLNKVVDYGLEQLCLEEEQKLLSLLNKEYNNGLCNEDQGRCMLLILYSKVVELDQNLKQKQNTKDNQCLASLTENK